MKPKSAPTRDSTLVAASDAPHPLNSWQAFAALLPSVGPCYSPACDGIGYRHRSRFGDEVFDEEWGNPSHEHTLQWTLLASYQALIATAGLEWIPPSARLSFTAPNKW
jgi:hypothetical protein